jgi:quinol monooxygenase YgiN
MIIEQLNISVPRGKTTELGRALASLIGPTRIESGCLSCRLFRDWQAPDELVVEANWATLEDLIRHLQSETYKRLLLLMELGRMPPKLQFCSVQEVNGLDLVRQAREGNAQELAVTANPKEISR